MNPPTMVYCGRFALLWHELPLADPEESSGVAGPNGGNEPHFLPKRGDKAEICEKIQAGSHWDLLLELDSGKLLTWQVVTLPTDEPPPEIVRITARRLPDHRSIYLDYEGPVSGNRGFVQQKAGGWYTATLDRPGLSSNEARIEFDLASASSNNHAGPIPEEVLSLDGSQLDVKLKSPTWSCRLRAPISGVGCGVCLEFNFGLGLGNELH